MASMTKKRKAPNLRVLQTEDSLRRLCKDKNQFEKYIPPHKNETQNQRDKRRRIIPDSVLTKEDKLERLEGKNVTRQTKKNTKAQKNSRQLKTQQIKEECSCAGEGRYGYDVKCKKSEWTAKPHCKDVDLPQKEKFEVTGRGGSPVYAWANVREATYINKDVQFLEPEIFYCKRDDEGATKHRFSVKFNNLKTDGMRFECTLKSISRCEIYFNGFKVGSMAQSYCSFAELLSRSEFLLINHKFTFDNGSTHWGQYESFFTKFVLWATSEACHC